MTRCSGRDAMMMRVARWGAMLAAAALLAPGTGLAQPSPVDTATAQLAQAESDLRSVDRALDGRITPDQRADLRDTATTARGAALAAAGQLSQQLALIDARLAQLGTSPAAGEAADIRAERARLKEQRNLLDSAVKRGRLLGVEADQLADEITQSQAEQFGQMISTRVASPVTPAFWSAVLSAAPRDTRRIAMLVAHGADSVAQGRRGAPPWAALLGLAAAVAIMLPGRLAAQRLALRLLIDGAPGHRVRRSANAIWRILVGTLAPLLATGALVAGLRWSGLQPQGWDTLFDALVGAASFAGFAASTTGALLMRHQPTWRVAPIADDVAHHLRPFSWPLAALVAFSILTQAVITATGISGAAVSATQVAEVLLHLAMIVGALVAVARLRAARADGDAETPARAGLGAASVVAWGMVATALIALLIGYLGFALFVVQLAAWAVILGSAVYLLMAAVDDIAVTVFTRDSPAGRILSRALGVRGTLIDQFGVLLSGIVRVMLAIAALGLLFFPFGAGDGVGSMFGRLATFASGVTVGGIFISPGAILRGLAVLFIGLTLLRAFMRWLEGKFLPATDLDGSGRNSISLVARYVGVALAVIWALASLGIGVERIALLLSALSVGIGFGLQAITSNFVSGLILLAERPIKIGDLVRIGADEGDVKRISVRSTEIELPDHSTLIVPNSELITKTVHNKTLASPLGRIQIQFSIPIEADADAARDIIAGAFAAEEAVLDDPAPAVFIDSIVDGRVFFNCFAHVASPRAAYRTRSQLFTVILRRFREDGIELGTVPQRMELIRTPGEPLPPTPQAPG
ncbi:DUF3772 domain-containing protein [Sphingomonas ginsenosidimutans]|jgi:small-conductance mechanosensitive channel|nr:DUF3772 domain-containing protein [Sphingomonas ginsenosidimutans]